MEGKLHSPCPRTTLPFIPTPYAPFASSVSTVPRHVRTLLWVNCRGRAHVITPVPPSPTLVYHHAGSVSGRDLASLEAAVSSQPPLASRRHRWHLTATNGISQPPLASQRHRWHLTATAGISQPPLAFHSHRRLLTATTRLWVGVAVGYGFHMLMCVTVAVSVAMGIGGYGLA